MKKTDETRKRVSADRKLKASPKGGPNFLMIASPISLSSLLSWSTSSLQVSAMNAPMSSCM